MSQLTITLNTILDEDGTELILPDRRELETRRRAMEKRIKGLNQTLNNTEDAAMKLYCQNEVDSERESYEELKAETEALRPEATVTKYVVEMPTYKEYIEAEGDATELNEDDGETTLDNQKLMDLLLTSRVRGLTSEEVYSLSPSVVRILWARLWSALNPSIDRICLFRSTGKRGTESG